MKIRAAILLLIAFVHCVPVSAFQYGGDSSAYSCIDPLICRLDSMSFSLLTRQSFYVGNDALIESIGMPLDQIPRYSREEVAAKMALIPSMMPLSYNNNIQQFIDFFAYKRRALMSNILANSQIYFPVFESVLDKRGLPLELKYLPVIESALNPIAVSRAGATGLWQMMYGTGKLVGLNVNSYIDDRRDPLKATEAAADYLKKLYDYYGDWNLVLAAYNSGPGTVNKAIARAGGVKNFWAIQYYLPAETRSYVPTFIAMVYVMTHFKDYKLVSDQPKRELYTVDTVKISAKVSLKHISDLLGISTDELQFLNPSLKVGIIPNSENGYELNLPVNYLALFETRKQDIMMDSSLLVRNYEPATFASKTIWHKVAKKETLAFIAAKYGVSSSSIVKWNKLKSSAVYPGLTLKIMLATRNSESQTYAKVFAPKIIDKVDSLKVPVQSPDSVIAAAPDTLNDTTAVAVKKPEIQMDKECGCVIHIVQPGDTIWSIVKSYEGLTLDKLKADNKSLLNRPIKVGDVLKIFR